MEGISKDTSDVDINTLKLLINLVRQAERDYLARKIQSSIRLDAYLSLFGRNGSPLKEPCQALGIDHVAARLKLILWRAKDKSGDPIFGWLQQERSVDAYERGAAIDFPTLAGLKYAGRGSDSVQG